MHTHVFNEVERLEQVIVHRPGAEIERMTQHDLESLLFDDLLSPSETEREHIMMCEILEAGGAEVIEIRDQLQLALHQAPRTEREQFVQRCCDLAGSSQIAPLIQDWPAKTLAGGLIHGLRWDEIDGAPGTLARLRDDARRGNAMVLPPVPNLMFMRDPCIAIYDSIVVGRMATEARARESLLVSFALRWGQTSAPPRFVFDQDERKPAPGHHTIEGGDILVLSDEVLMIGCSQRSSPQCIQHLVEDTLFPAHPRLKRVYVVMMPQARSVMHLDTILTQVDRHLFLGHRPMIDDGVRGSCLSVALLSRDAAPTMLNNATVLDVLRNEFGSEVDLHPCGGDNPLYQEREQWTDGANAVCLAPGHIILYARNVETIRTLRDRGFEEVCLNVFQPSDVRRERIREGMARSRCVFSFSGSELSRARGGGRCLTMPLRRAAH